MKTLKIFMLVLMMSPGIAFSQYLSITKVDRDSIVSKIIRGNKAIDQNKVYVKQIANRDSIIFKHNQLQEVSLSTIKTLKDINYNLDIIIEQKDQIIVNEKKIGRKKRNAGLIKGATFGLLVGILLFN